ncbi:MAG: hypothetical protein AVDCRST_MAG10-1448, partial [uncultured Acidimicrobiales bacterium]
WLCSSSVTPRPGTVTSGSRPTTSVPSRPRGRPRPRRWSPPSPDSTSPASSRAPTCGAARRSPRWPPPAGWPSSRATTWPRAKVGPAWRWSAVCSPAGRTWCCARTGTSSRRCSTGWRSGGRTTPARARPGSSTTPDRGISLRLT